MKKEEKTEKRWEERLRKKSVHCHQSEPAPNDVALSYWTHGWITQPATPSVMQESAASDSCFSG
jgi:hypothetical protein